MAELFQQLRAFHAGLDPARRRTLWAALVLSLLTIAGVGIWASQPRHVPLTRPADPDEREEITEALSRAGILWQLGPQDVIEVLEQDETKARAAAASDHGILGLEGLEQIDPWATPFVEMLQKQRMLQGEIVRSLNHMDGVAKSACILNLPSPSDFIGRTSRATAAVTLSPDPGTVLDPQTGRAVAEFVSHAVAGMTPDDVSVVDTSTGRSLWSGGSSPQDDAEGGLASRREAALAAKVERVLASMLGSPTAFSVAVMVDLSSATTATTTHSVDPDSAAPTTEQIESEANSSASTSGVPGTDSNLPERTTGTSGGESRSRERQQTTYLYTRTETTTSQPAGELKRLSASVVVDRVALQKLAGEGQTLDETAEKARIEALVKAALGADAARGDSVVVEIAPFAEVPLSAEEAPTLAGAAWERWIPVGVAALAVLLVLLFGVRPLIRAAAPPKPVPAPAGELPAAATGSRLDVAVGEGEGEGEGEVIDLAARLRKQLESYKQISTEDVSALVRQEREHSAEVLRRWIRK